MKILILDFENAGWFNKNLNFDKDIVLDLNGQTNRSSIKKQFKEPITKHQISNVLHVLFGERPTPSLRESIFTPIREIQDIANNSYLKVDKYYELTNDNKKMTFSEFLVTNKAVWNSTEKKRSLLYWRRIKKFLEENMYNDYISTLTEVLKENPVNKPFIKSVITIRKYHMSDSRIIDLLLRLKKTKKTPLYNIFLDSKYWDGDKYIPNIDFNSNVRIALKTIRGVSRIVRLSGKIIVPIENKWLEKLKHNTGVATILDGGVVTINSIKSEYDFSDQELFGFEKVGEISDELVKY